MLRQLWWQLFPHIGKRIFLHRRFHVGIGYMGVDLRRVQLLVPENFLQYADIDLPGLIKQCRRGVPELVD